MARTPTARRQRGIQRKIDRKDRSHPSNEPEKTVQADAPTTGASVELSDDESRREQLLVAYKAATGNPSNKSLYEAKNSGIHKPEFYSWVSGDLPADSATAINFETFLRLKKPPIPRKPKD